MSIPNIYKLIGLSFLIVITSVLISCEDENDEGNQNSFDRSAMLESLATELIIPNFTSLSESVASLSQSVDTFIANPNEQNLEAMRTSWKSAVVDHQHCSAFGFGPANLNLGPYATVLGVFPVDIEAVEENILDDDFQLSGSFARDIRGFYTIEYLIYGDGESDAVLIAGFDENRQAYLKICVDELKNTFNDILSEWNNGYKDTFVASDGSSAGSSISLLYNEFIKDYENLKNYKVELPAGLTAGQASSDPSLVEAYYSGISTQLIKEHFSNSVNIWKGRTRAGVDIIGFEENLQALVGGDQLIDQTTEKIAQIEAAINNLPEGELSQVVESDEVKQLRDRLQANTANFKSSMSSLLGISITFTSGDGD